jgi:hypothetical protein
MHDREVAAPDNTAVRVALWRALHVEADALAERYFAGRTDGLRPPDNSEELLVATTRNQTGRFSMPSFSGELTDIDGSHLRSALPWVLLCSR